MQILTFFWTYAGAAALCFSGWVAAQNVTVQVSGMLGRWRMPYWDYVLTDPGIIHGGLAFVAMFGGAFACISYAAVRRNVLTRNHILIVLAGVALFVVLVAFDAAQVDRLD